MKDIAPADGRPYGFKPGAGNDALYQHDDNGNLTYDPHKGLSMQYNFLNLPSQIGQMRLLYDAAGRKWSKEGESGRVDYIAGFEFRGGKLEAVYAPDGRLVAEYQGLAEPQRYRAEYFHQDHPDPAGAGQVLGNTRLVFSDFNQNGLIELTEEDPTTPLNEFEITQEAHYYPFGMGHLGPWYETVAPENKYLYNGKELSEDYEIDLMDYGARWYDGAIGRWNAVDPLAEKYAGWSPYNYVMGNPIRLVDPDGQSVTDDYKLRQNGKLELIRKTEEKFDRITTEDGSKSIEVTKISSIVEGNSGQVLWFNNAESGRKYYEFAAENTNVEFAMIEAIAVKKLKGFENATFEVFSPSQRTITTYDGINKAVVRKKN